MNTSIISKPFNGYYSVTSNHMRPRILAGDVVELKSINVDGSVPGELCLIAHRTKGLLLRKVTDQGNTLQLSAYNKEECPTFEALKSDVLALARVVRLIRTDI